MLPGSTAECELQCYAQKSADYTKCQGYAVGSAERANCFALADGELTKCLSACRGGSGTGALAVAAGALALLWVLS